MVTYLLRYEYMKSIPAKPGSFESHDNYEIFYFHEGRGNYLIGDKIHHLVPGTLLLMHGLTQHSPCSFDGFPYVRTLINFDQAYVRAACEFLFKVNVLHPFENSGNIKLNLKEGEREELEALLAKMDQLRSQSDDLNYDRFRLAFLDVLFLINSLLKKPHCNQPQILGSKERHIQSTLTYIEGHYTEDLTLNQIEQDLHINKYYLSRLFHEVTGMTIFQYVYRRRLNQAKLLFLLEPEQSITDICFLSGFKNVSHFSKAFKQYEGQTPKEYRRELVK